MRKQLAILFCLILFGKTLGLTGQHIYINEFLASNVSIDADIIDFDDYSDWVELYNDENVECDISGYSFTDNPDQPGKWIIPDGTTIQPKGFLRCWADGYDAGPGETHVRSWLYDPDMSQKWIYFTTDYYHLNFSLSRAGEYIGLYDPDGNVVDSLTFGLQLRDVSMGRQPDGASAWFYFGEPTPESSNTTEGILDPVTTGHPEITPESGFYNSTQTVTISTGQPGTSVRYTLDGSKPMSTSDSSGLPLDLTVTTVLRARLFEPGNLPGEITDRTYFVNEDFSLPVISIITPPEALWDHEKGICETRMKSREIPVRFQYFPEGIEPLIDMNAGLRLTGQLSLYCPQVSFTIYARDRYGTDEISGRVFPQRELNSFKSLYLRNSGVPDNWVTHFRDAMSHSLVVNKMDLDCQAFQPSVLFLNGRYWGLYNIREKINADYIAALHHVNPDEIDLLEYESGNSTPEVLEGSGEDYDRFYEFIEDHDLSTAENYRIIESWMDVDEFINYQICEIYFDNIIWPYINVRMWRERKEGAKWRWILFDTDYGFGMPDLGSTGYTNNTLAFATSSPTVPDPPPEWSTLIFRKMLSNPEFRIRFIQRFSGYLNSVFHPDTVVGVISELQATLGPEMTRHIQRWRYETFDFGSPIPSYGTWTSNVNDMRDFGRNRPRFQRQHIASYFGLEGTSVVSVHIDHPGAGRVLVNEIVSVDSSASGIYFQGIPIKLRAVPEVGFELVGWEGITVDSVDLVDFLPGSDTITVTALFDPIVVSKVPGEIIQDTVLLKANSPYYATGDIIVPPGKTLAIESGVDLYMPEKANIIVYGKLIIEGTSDEPVKILPNEHSSKWGGLCFVEATDSSVISDLYISGATNGVDFARDRAAISGFRSRFSLENVTIENSDLPVFVQFGSVSISGCRLRSGTTGDLINIKKADYAIVEGCDLRGNDYYDSDAIDYDGISNGTIRYNRIYNFYGYNSDAIDLGEGCKGILVEGNLIYNIDDKGVSIGTGSTATIQRNLFANCGQGVGIKDFGSYGDIVHNTFYANGYGIACFVKNIGCGGGNADVVNCIIADSRVASAWADDQSTINLSYSLINTDSPSGLHNIYDQPLFTNNLYLAGNSPAVNSGNPSLPHDPDGSLPDMGAYPYDPEMESNIRIDEIYYHPVEGEVNAFVEIINTGEVPVQLNGFSFSGDITFTFPDKIIQPDELIVVAKDQSLYEGSGYTVYGWEEGELPDGPGTIVLHNSLGEVVDFVDYDSQFWWPREPDGQGPSLELHEAELENMVSCNWRSSYLNGGTPGKASNSELLSEIFINELMASNSSCIADEYGDFDDWIELFNASDKSVNIAGLYVTDDFEDPFKYRIPLSDLEATSIPAGGFLLLWADGEAEEGILHLDFKLDMEGEDIGLVQMFEDEARYIDSLSYPGQLSDVSIGRYPDGDAIHHLSGPTPQASNLYTAIRQDEPDQESVILSQNYPNPFSSTTIISYRLPDDCMIELNVYDKLGRRVAILESGLRPEGIHQVVWNANGMEPGIYLCELRTRYKRQVIKMILTN